MRRFVTLLLALGFVLAAPGSAWAHDVLEKTTPADGTSVQQLPTSVSLTFSDQPLAIGTQIIVKGPTGDVTSGAPTIEGRVVTQALAATAPAGDYVVTYRVTSDDGHPVGGTFSFHAGVGLDGSTATAGATVHVPAGNAADEPAGQSQFVPVMLSIVGTIVLIALVVFVVVRGRQRS